MSRFLRNRFIPGRDPPIFINWAEYYVAQQDIPALVEGSGDDSYAPVRSVCGVRAVASTPGVPSYTMTRSARYVAMIKSCSTTKAVRFACKINRLITWAHVFTLLSNGDASPAQVAQGQGV